MAFHGRTVAKNVGVMMASQLITWTLSIALALVMPRLLGPVAMGQYSLANSIWQVAAVLVVFGMDLHLTKSIARDPTLFGTLLGTSLALRLVLFAFSSLFVVGYLVILQADPLIWSICGIIGFSFLWTGLASGFMAALTGIERMEFISLSTIFNKVVIAGGSILVLLLGFRLYAVVIIQVLGAFTQLSILLIATRRLSTFRLRFARPQAIEMLQASSPYLFTALTLTVYQQLDRLLIAALSTVEAIGWYGTANNLFSTLMFLPVVFTTVLFPAMARSYQDEGDQFSQIARRSFDLMLILSVPIGIGLAIIARPLVDLIYGSAFAPTADLLAIFGLVLIFTYLNTLVGQLLIAVDRTRLWNTVMVVAVLVTIPLDLWLIPIFDRAVGNGALAGVLTFLLTEFGMTAAAILLLPKGLFDWRSVRSAALIGVAGFGMAAAIWPLHEQQMFLAVGVGALIYPVLIIVLRIIRPEDLQVGREMAGNLLKRLRRNGATT